MTRQAVGEISIPIHWRFKFCAATSAVPQPQNGKGQTHNQFRDWHRPLDKGCPRAINELRRAGILFDSTNQRLLIHRRFVDQQQVANARLGKKKRLNQRTSRSKIWQGWVDYEQVGTSAFTRKSCLDQRTNRR
jgi:hypothetical protein